jgi:hypothetical protein
VQRVIALAKASGLGFETALIQMAQASRIAKRVLSSVTGGVSAYGVYKAKYDPPHIVWDLDDTLLHSVSPVELALSTEAYPSDPDRYFDHIDDDFPYEKGIANTRTYWRPGARQALQFCRLFSHQHVFTTAQGSYTENVMRELDPNRTIFDKVVHRDMFPESVTNGKDLSLITDKMDRAVLFDDKLQNFRPQNGTNGVLTQKYTNVGQNRLREMQEVARMVGICLLVLLATDVRDVVKILRSKEHKEQFGKQQHA